MPYRVAVTLVRALLRIFFRRMEVIGLENIPEQAGGLVISWHPNALVDGALILAFFPRRIVFGARHGLFRWPLLGRMLRALDMVPVYRRQDFASDDDDARRTANAKSIDALAGAIANGSFSALFPEGDSHDEPTPTELKTGAARLYYRACALTSADRARPVVIPVGLHYDKKRVFGSRALVVFHPPIAIPSDLEDPVVGASFDDERARYRALTETFEVVLREVVHGTESWKLHYGLHRARKLMQAERAARSGSPSQRPGMIERILAFKRLWAGYNARAQTHPEAVEALVARVNEYDTDLIELGMHDHELDASPRFASPWLGAILVLQAILVYLLLPPILVVGYVVNLPAAVAVWAVSKSAARKTKDEASLKLVAGAVAFPLTWLAVAALVGWGKTYLQAIYLEVPGSPLMTGAAAFALSAVGAWVALNYQRLARQTLRSIRVRLTRLRRKQTLARLRSERSQLFDAFVELAQGLDLPETLTADD